MQVHQKGASLSSFYIFQAQTLTKSTYFSLEINSGKTDELTNWHLTPNPLRTQKNEEK